MSINIFAHFVPMKISTHCKNKEDVAKNYGFSYFLVNLTTRDGSPTT